MLRDFSKDEFDIFIQAGQSNSEGGGIGDASNPYVPSENVWYLNGNMVITVAHEAVNGNNIVSNFSLSFAREYIEKGLLKPGRKLLILRTAFGGTSFSGGHWRVGDGLYNRMLNMAETALNLNPKNKLAGLLWHQGEHDAGAEVSRDTHYNNLSALVSGVRGKFNINDLPFIAADLCNQWKTANIKICEPVVQAIKDVCADIGSARFTETEGLQSNDQRLGNGDTPHFCREALYQLGVKYFEAYKEIIGV